MAEQKEIFNILKDANGDGEALTKRSNTETWNDADNGAPVFIARDAGGSARVLHARDEGTSAPTQQVMPTFVAKDENGNLQYIPMDNGAVVVTSEGQGSLLRSMSSGTVGTVGSFGSAVILGLSLSKQYDDIEICVSSFKDCTWKLWYIDDAGGPGEALTDIEYFRTGAGQYTFKTVLSNYRLDTSAGTGVQQLALEIKQRSGTGSDFTASIAVIERNP